MVVVVEEEEVGAITEAGGRRSNVSPGAGAEEGSAGPGCHEQGCVGTLKEEQGGMTVKDGYG